MADIGFTIALEGIALMQSQLDKLRGQVEKATNETQKKLGGISDFFVQSLKQGSPLVGRAIEAYMNPMQGAIQLTADLVGSLGNWVHGADEAAAAGAKLDAVLMSTNHAAGLTKKELDAMAKTLEGKTLFDDDAITGAQSILLTFTKLGKEVFPDANEAVLNMATLFGGDLQSNAIRVGKALQEPVEGASALRRIGVQLTDQMEEQIKAFVEQGDIVSAQKVILHELTTEMGGQAKAVREAGLGPWKAFKIQLENVTETIGDFLIPVFNALAFVLTPLTPIIIPLTAAIAAATVATLAWNNATLSMIGRAIAGAIPALTGFTLAAWAAVAPIVAMYAPVIAITAAVAGVGAVVVGAIQWFKSMGESAAESAVQLAKSERELKKITDRFREMLDEIERFEAQQAFDSMISATEKAFLKENKLFDDLSKGVRHSSKDIKDELAKLEKQLETLVPGGGAINTGDRGADMLLRGLQKSIVDPYEATKAKIAILKRELLSFEDVKPGPAKGSIGDLQQQLSALKDQIDNTFGGIDTAQLNAQIDQLTKKIEEKTKGQSLFSTPSGSALTDSIAETQAALEALEPTTVAISDNLSSYPEVMRQTAEEAASVGNALRNSFDSAGVKTDEFIAKMDQVKESMKSLAKAVKENVAAAFGELAFNLGNAIAMGQDLGVVMQQFISDLIAQVGKMVGLALIHSALTAPFPVSLGLLAAGLAIMGISGLLSGALKPKGADSGVPDMSQSQPQRPANSPGLSSFNDSTFNPVINIDGPITLQVGDEKMDAYLFRRDTKRRVRRGG